VANREKQKKLLCNDSVWDSVPVLKPSVNKISIIDIVDISKSMTFYYRRSLRRFYLIRDEVCPVLFL